MRTQIHRCGDTYIVVWGHTKNYTKIFEKKFYQKKKENSAHTCAHGSFSFSRQRLQANALVLLLLLLLLLCVCVCYTYAYAYMHVRTRAQICVRVCVCVCVCVRERERERERESVCVTHINPSCTPSCHTMFCNTNGSTSRLRLCIVCCLQYDTLIHLRENYMNKMPR